MKVMEEEDVPTKDCGRRGEEAEGRGNGECKGPGVEACGMGLSRVVWPKWTMYRH